MHGVSCWHFSEGYTKYVVQELLTYFDSPEHALVAQQLCHGGGEPCCHEARSTHFYTTRTLVEALTVVVSSVKGMHYPITPSEVNCGDCNRTRRNISILACMHAHVTMSQHWLTFALCIADVAIRRTLKKFIRTRVPWIVDGQYIDRGDEGADMLLNELSIKDTVYWPSPLCAASR